MIHVNETSDKLAVIETLYRFAAGLDLRDDNLLASAFAVDAVSDFRPAGKMTSPRKTGQLKTSDFQWHEVLN